MKKKQRECWIVSDGERRQINCILIGFFVVSILGGVLKLIIR